MIDGTREPFQVDIDDCNTVFDLKKIKMESPRLLPPASTHSLYKAPEGVDITEPGVTVLAKDEIGTTSSLRGMFAETNTAQVIVRPPSKSVLLCLSLFLFPETIF